MMIDKEYKKLWLKLSKQSIESAKREHRVKLIKSIVGKILIGAASAVIGGLVLRTIFP